VLPCNHAASCSEPSSGLLVGAVVFQRQQNKISHEAVRNDARSKALPLLGIFLVMIFHFDSEPHVFVCLADSHDRNNGKLRHYDFGVKMS